MNFDLLRAHGFILSLLVAPLVFLGGCTAPKPDVQMAKARVVQTSVRKTLQPVARKVFQNQIVALSFSPSGKKIFAASNDVFSAMSAKVLDAHSLNVLSNFSLPKAAQNVILTVDWTKYVVFSAVPSVDPLNSQQSNYRLRLYDLRSGKPLGANSEVSFAAAGLGAISPRGDVLALIVGVTNRGW